MSSKSHRKSTGSNWYFPSDTKASDAKKDKLTSKNKSKSSSKLSKAEKEQSVLELESRARKSKGASKSENKHLKSFKYSAPLEKKSSASSSSTSGSSSSSNGNNLFEFLSNVNNKKLRDREEKKSSSHRRSSSSKSRKSKKNSKKSWRKKNKCCDPSSSSTETCEQSTESSECCKPNDCCDESSSSSDDCASTCSDSSDSSCEDNCCPPPSGCHCNGDLTVTGRILAGSGTAQLPGYSFGFAGETGISQVVTTAGNGLSFSTGGVSRLIIDANGASFTVPITAPSIITPQSVIGLNLSGSVANTATPLTWATLQTNPTNTNFAGPALSTANPLVIPANGLYEIQYQLNWTPTLATSVSVGATTSYILVNGTTQYAVDVEGIEVGETVQDTNNGSVLLNLVAGDTVSLVALQTAVTAGTIPVAASSYLQVYRVASTA